VTVATNVMDTTPLVDIVRAAVPGAKFEPAASVDMPTMFVDREHLLETCQALRDAPDLQFAFLVDVTAVDFLPREPRYEVVYHLACLGPAYAQPQGAAPPRRLRLKVQLAGDDAHVPSVSGVWPTAGWPEREVFDLFGIAFDGHPDLRRILMTDDWEGHPLRKDYPVQIRKETSSWQAMQLSPDEFAASIRAARERAQRDIEDAGG
jgi:NADH-quinone oxidoreductase subunit C